MPQYLSTRQPEALLLRRRLDGHGSLNRNIHHPPLPQHPTNGGRGDERRMLGHRSTNTSHQAVRFEEAQRRVKRVEEFKRAQKAFATVIPLRCWSGLLPIARFYRDGYITSPMTFIRTVSPLSMSIGTTVDEDDDDDDDGDALLTMMTCSNCASSLPPIKGIGERTSPFKGHSRPASSLKHIPRNLTASRQVDVDGGQRLKSDAADAEDGGVAETE